MTNTPTVGTECRNCLGTGTPEHFSLNQPEGRVYCQPCGGTGVIRDRVMHAPARQPVEVSTPASRRRCWKPRALPADVACLDCQRFGYAADCPTCGGVR